MIGLGCVKMVGVNRGDVYEPSDDSFFLADFVRDFASGRVLDMGSGSGFLAEVAVSLSGVSSVFAVDVSDASVSLLRSKNISCMKSDLFANFSGGEVYDTVVFNPPYLPQDKGISDVSLYGGRKGYEVIKDFLFSVSPFVSENGKILLLFSSLTGRSKVEKFIVDCGFKFSVLGSKKLFMEELFVVCVEKSDFLKHVESKGVSCVREFSKGKRSVVFSGFLKGKRVAIKVESKSGVVSNEVKFLRKLNKVGVGPELFFSSKGFFVCEFVDGLRVLDFFEKSSKKDILKVVREIFLQCRLLDSLFIEKSEMSNPYKHVLINDGKRVFFIDFERSRFKDFPSNVTQFVSFLFRKKVVSLLSSKNIFFNRELCLDFCKNYKRNQSEKVFDDFLAKI